MQTLPISFAKQTFSACQVLLVYLIISATRMLVLIERRVDRLIERDRAAGVGGVVVADESERRLPEVLQRRSLAKELRIDRHAEPFAVLLAGGALERRDDHVVRGSRQHGAPDDDHVVGGLLRELVADLRRHPLEIREVEAAVLPAGRADAEQRHLRRRDRVGRVGRRPQPPCGDGVAPAARRDLARRSDYVRR